MFLRLEFVLGMAASGYLGLWTWAWGASAAAEQKFQAGVATVDITPTEFPAIIAGGFLEAQAEDVQDRLWARSYVLDNGQVKLAMVVVDTCMMPRDLIDRAKTLAHQQCGIAVDHILVSATHTHSAPAAMSCLGTRQDTNYAARLPEKIAQSIVLANSQLQPARIGWGAIDDWEQTHNRRWIRRPERKVIDPYGQATGLANMHPGYLSPDVIGPSGPVDPSLSVIAIQTAEGKPLGVFANYSQHYFGTQAVSADYYGDFCKYVAQLLDQPGEGNGPFVCALSQGTSGDLMWMDYGTAQKSITRQRYAEALARYAEKALQSIQYRDSVELGMVEKLLNLNYRTPDAARLEWAKPIAAAIENDVPKDRTQVYAQEALILHGRQRTEIKLQALRIGDLTIAALPNEVYALTGLKLRARSPFQQHFNIELANGGDGYIPTPEQHVLGGYTTWPARTAGLEVQAEPRIVDTLLEGLEQVTGQKRRQEEDQHGPYARSILSGKPVAYWRLNDMDGNQARNAVPGGTSASFSPGFAWYLPGVGSGSGVGEQAQLRPSAFSGPNQINRAAHFAGGELQAKLATLPNEYSIAFWFWLGERSGASQRTGTLLIGPMTETLRCIQDAEHRVQLDLGGQLTHVNLQADQWHWVVLTRKGKEARLWIDAQEGPVWMDDRPAPTKLDPLVFGRELQGKLDEIAVFPQAIDGARIKDFWNLAHAGPDARVSATAGQVPRPVSESLSPEKSLQAIHVPDGFRVELVACEPQTLDPVAFDWDEHGRLWVVEMADYPLGMDGQGQPGGRVRVLEDRDGDGSYESSRLFADGLNFPNGILTWREGVLVTAAPDILYLRDGDGDGVADQREVLFTGFLQGNQQLRLNGLRWGIDGWVYCANGGHHPHYGKETKVQSTRTGRQLGLGSRDFRFHPDTGAMELESGPSQFGRNRDAWGHWFGTQNASPLWHYVIPDRYSARNPYVPTPTPLRHIVGPGSPVVYPASPPEKRYHSFEQSGRFTSACGGMIYGDQQLFGASDSLHAFTCEPFHNLVQHNVLTDAGISFAAHRQAGEEKQDFFASEDRWCRPVMARTGPDGALWVADMYRYMIEHPEWLPAHGKEDLLPHYRLGDDRGRIYRVVRSDNQRRKIESLASLPAKELAGSLDSSNDAWRDKIQQMLLWKRSTKAIEPLREMVRSGRYPQARLQALWTLDLLGQLPDELLGQAMSDAHPRVRENAIRIAETRSSESLVAAACSRSNDPDAKVRLQLALSLGYWKDQAGMQQAFADLARQDNDDPLMVAALMSSAVSHAAGLRSALMTAEPKTLRAYREPMLRMAIGSGDRTTVTALLQAAMADPKTSIATLSGLHQSLKRCGVAWEELKEWNDVAGIPGFLKSAERTLELARHRASDEKQEVSRRIEAAALMSILPETRDAGIDALQAWLGPQYAAEDQLQAMNALADTASARVPSVLARGWRELSPGLRERALEVWLSRNEWTYDLLARIQKMEIPVGVLDPARRDRLIHHPAKDIAGMASEVLKTSASAPRTKVVEGMRAALVLPSDVSRGQAVYLRACSACHRQGSQGLDIGPNLATVISHTPERLLTAILDPNADIQPGYQRYSCVLDSGLVLSGLLTSETANSITMKLADGTARTLSRSEIQSLQNTNVSLMPEELEKVLTAQDLADLITWLRMPK
jgi:putative membrane-bound dehydrogenase-like protein